jgi:predicted nucleotidyltransferase
MQMHKLSMPPEGSTEFDVEKLDKDLQLAFEELVITLTGKYGNQISSIVVFGSATTGDWIRGKSDVDFIIVIIDKRKKKEVENFTNNLLVKLSTKYDLRLIQTSSAFKKTRNPALKAVYSLESFMTFGKPFFVLARDQIRVERGEIRDARIMFVTSIFDSIAVFATKMKQTGCTIYGEDILKDLDITRSSSQKMKALIAPLWLIIMSLAVFPLDASLAMDHSIKATLWACEDVLFYLDHSLSSMKNEVTTLKKILPDCGSNKFDHAEHALRLRLDQEAGTKTKKGLVVRFLLRTPYFVLSLYGHALTSARTKSR